VSVRYLDLADYISIVASVTGLDVDTVVKVANLDLADSALHAPSAGFGDTDFYPEFVDKAAVLMVRYQQPPAARRQQARRMGRAPLLPGPQRTGMGSRAERR
jgi:hypothetical protein